MKHVFFKELKLNLKQILIWSLTVGILGFVSIMLYSSMQGDMKSMADMFSSMGAFSDAFGMSTLSIATIEGYFATEIGVIHGLGSAMFAAITAIVILSKEEERHTGEFLLSLPLSRSKVLLAKGLCILCGLVIFTVLCGLMYLAAFAGLGEGLTASELMKFLLLEFLMNVEVAAVCFLISAVSTRIKMGLGLGLALIFYVYDLMGRVVPDLKDYLFIGPFSYANASEILSGAKVSIPAVSIAGVVIAASIAAAVFVYNKRDLVS
ncbi:MAG: ABC transporter permease subunit [Lachnospiraceae bacterium]|nr:ABC transporter permease subunit [Lachnospiraceae bacterium]